MEGATFPPTLETEKQFEEKKVITGTYGIYLTHFLKNAEPNEECKVTSHRDIQRRSTFNST